MGPAVIVIARSEQAVGLRKRLGNDPSVALFTDSDSLKALEAILSGPPKILALDRSFVATARAAALVARVKSEPHLRATDVRVLAEDETNLPVLLSSRAPGLEGALMRSSYPLDYCGTRRAPRFLTTHDVNVAVNGEVRTAHQPVLPRRAIDGALGFVPRKPSASRCSTARTKSG